MARMKINHILATASLSVVTAATVAHALEDDERAFGRVSPERPVIEIAAEELEGVDASAVPLTPIEGWTVRSDEHVVPIDRPKTLEQQKAEKELAELASIVEQKNPETLDEVIDLLDQQIAAQAGESAPIASAAPTQAGATDAAPITPPISLPVGEERTPITVPEGQTLASAAPLGTPLGSPRTAPDIEQQPLENADADSEGLGWLAQTGLALAGVLALILILAWIFDRATRGSRGLGAAIASSKSPAGLIEVLAKYPVSPRQSMLLMKFDRRVLLLSQSTPRSGPVTTNTLCELTDPEDVASVLVKVRDAQGESMNHLFKEAMSKADAHTARALNEPARPATPAAAASPIAGAKPAAEITPKPASPNAAPGAAQGESFASDFDPEALRQTVGGDEAERAQLWEDLGKDQPANDPASLIRRRVQAMRGSVSG